MNYVRLATFVSVVTILFVCTPRFSQAESINVMLQVAVCNTNLICEDVIGEDYIACPSDCEAPPMPTSTPTTTPDVNINTGGGQTGGGFSGGSNTNQVTGGNVTNTNTDLTSGGNIIKTNSVFRPNAIIPEAGIVGAIRLTPTSNGATLNFRTSLSSLMTISWGSTATYEMGTMAESWYYQNFSKSISGLNPGTRYYYRIELIDSIGRRTQYEGRFVTADQDYKAKLPSVRNFSVSPSDVEGSAVLTWDISSIFNLADTQSKDTKGIFVRVVRSEFDYPTEPFDGKVVYEGSEEQFTDSNLDKGKVYYYSAFVGNSSKNYSSPAITVFKSGDKGDVLLRDSKGITDLDTGVVNANEKARIQPTLCSSALSGEADKSKDKAKQVLFIQEKQVINSIESVRRVDANYPFIVRVDLGKNEAKYVSLCIFSPIDNVWSYYLLSKNQDGSYGIILPAFNEEFSGKKDYEFVLGMLEYKGEKRVIETGVLEFDHAQKNQKASDIFKAISIFSGIFIIWFIRRIILWLI